MSFFSELKRRNVVRVAIGYLAASWLVTEVAGTVLPVFGYGDSALRIIIICLLIALVPVLVFSWAFEITPEGLKREVDVEREHSITRFTGKKIDRIIMVLLALSLGYFAFDKFVLDPVEDDRIAQSAREEGRSDALNEAYGDNSVAVLAFSNMSSDPEQEYFSDGLSDTLIHVLGQVSGLRVTAKTSSFYFKGKDATVSEIAKRLQVEHILEGSVQKFDGRIRTIVQLIRAPDDTQLWSKSFDRDIQDIFAVQDEIAREVVAALKVTLLDAEEERLLQRYRPNLAAYEQLILGRHEKAKRTADSLAAAERHFKRAIELDPGYALAYVGLANTYRHQAFEANLYQPESLRLQEPLIEKALELDPDSSEAHLSRAGFLALRNYMTGQENWEPEYQIALELSPNHAVAHRDYGNMLSRQGRFEEALKHARLAAKLDPMDAAIHASIAKLYWNIGNVDEAIEQIKRNIGEWPAFPANYGFMSEFLSDLGRLGEAQRWRLEWHRSSPGNAQAWATYCSGFLDLEDVNSARECMEQLGNAYPGNHFARAWWLPVHRFQRDWSTALTLTDSLIELWGGWRDYKRFRAELLVALGKPNEARLQMNETYPDLLESEVQLSTTFGGDLNAALVFAAILNAAGELEQRDILLTALENAMAEMQRIHGEGYGVLDMYVHAIRGNRELALAAFKEAVDLGWKVSMEELYLHWWHLPDDWMLGDLRQDPEFIILFKELEAQVAVQRQWYEENKNSPLF